MRVIYWFSKPHFTSIKDDTPACLETQVFSVLSKDRHSTKPGLQRFLHECALGGIIPGCPCERLKVYLQTRVFLKESHYAKIFLHECPVWYHSRVLMTGSRARLVKGTGLPSLRLSLLRRAFNLLMWRKASWLL